MKDAKFEDENQRGTSFTTYESETKRQSNEFLVILYLKIIDSKAGKRVCDSM